MKTDQKQALIDEMLFDVERNDFDFAIIDKDGDIIVPLISCTDAFKGFEGIITRNGNLAISPERGLTGYRGLALEINDHGNVTVWKCFKNGNRREIASRV